MKISSPIAVLVVSAVCAGSSPLVARTSAQASAAKQTEKDPTEGSKDVQREIPYPVDRVMAAAKQAAATYGCDIKKERPDYLECTRSRHVGVFVGSGGEKVTLQLSSTAAGTRIVVETGKGFVGRLGKKNWSTPFFNEIVRLLEAS